MAKRTNKSWKFNKDGNYYKNSVQITMGGVIDRVHPNTAKALDKAGLLDKPKPKTTPKTD